MAKKQTEKKYTVEIDITPYVQAFLDSGLDFNSIPEAVRVMVANAISIRQMAHIGLGGRELGEVPHDILPSNDEIYERGLAQTWQETVVGLHEKVQINGTKEIRVRALLSDIAVVEYDDTAEKTASPVMSPTRSPKGARNAESWLRRTVPGMIRNPLFALALNGVDHNPVCNWLIETIERLRGECTEIAREHVALEVAA